MKIADIMTMTNRTEPPMRDFSCTSRASSIFLLASLLAQVVVHGPEYAIHTIKVAYPYFGGLKSPAQKKS
ncbi:MAG TPA: hypothetical protein VE692_00020 [Nitrososphaera sp.]|jgi:hypothetical protein|nr:hypothetical protein [Nitrososphaera sp.]